MTQKSKQLPLFLDTTLQVDRCLSAHDSARSDAVAKLLGDYNFLVSCVYSRLEFKRVVLQNIALILRYIVEADPPSFFGALLRVSKLNYTPRKASTLANILAWIGHNIDSNVQTGEVGSNIDLVIARRAESYIRNTIKRRWLWYRRTIDSLVDRMNCQRGKEQPVENADGSIDTSVHESACKNKGCNIANFFREQMSRLKKLLADLKKAKTTNGQLTDELEDAIRSIEAAIKDPTRLYNYNRCLELSDVWIHLESVAAGISDFGTTNYKESDLICPSLGLTKRQP